MAYQTVFKRYEMKYMLTQGQKQMLLDVMAPYMIPDDHGATVIRNVYYDTDTYRLIRRSIEKPKYKEKLRIRSYTRAESDSTVFVELKKKCKSVVYKRRISLPEADAVEWVAGRQMCPRDTQIAREIDYFMDFYGEMNPTVFLSYKREAFFGKSDRDLRITFDCDILARTEEVSLEADLWGTPLLGDGLVLMEVKCAGGMPLWLTHALTEAHIYKTSFSKYGKAYAELIFPKLKENNNA